MSSTAYDWFVGIHCGYRCSGILRSILSCAIAPPTFLRESPLTNIVSSSAAVGRRGLIDANSSPEVHSNQRIVLRLIVMQFAASTVPCELDFPGGISHHRCGDGDRTTGRISAHRLLDHEDGSGLIHAARAAWARHSEDVCCRRSICQITVASFRITATRANVLPRRRRIRLYHSRSRPSFRRAWCVT